MIILSTTNDKIEVVLGEAQTSAAMQCFASFRDITTSAYSPSRQLSTTNGTTPVDMVSAPGASTQRVVDYVSVYNADTAAKTLIVRFDDGSNKRTLFRASLSPGEIAQYNDGSGWQVLTNIGSVKQSLNQGTNAAQSSGKTQVVLNSDQVNNNGTLNTWQDVTGLSFPVTGDGTNTYYFRFVIFATTNATATGFRFAVSGPTNNILGYTVTMPTSATAAAFNSVATYDSTTLQTGVAVATPNPNIVIIEGYIRPTANGSVIARFACELAGPTNNVTVLRGSFVEYQKMI
jgi:hypothetical protein